MVSLMVVLAFALPAIAIAKDRLSYEQAYWRPFHFYEYNALPFTAPPRMEPEPAIAPSRIHPDVRPPSYRRSFSRARGYPDGYASSNSGNWPVHPGYSYGAPIVRGAYPWEDRNQVDKVTVDHRGRIEQAVRQVVDAGPGTRRSATGFQGTGNHLGSAHNFDHDVVRTGEVGKLGKPRGFPH